MDNILRKNNFLLISIGAVPGTILRWQIDQVFIVNLIGCFLLGFINALNIPEKYKLTFGFGFCGCLTTFSGWTLQLLQLLRKGLYNLFIVNSIAIVITGIIAIALGNLLAKKFVNY